MRRTAVVLSFLVLLPAGPVLAQAGGTTTSSTSTSSTSTSIPATTTTVAPTTTTTPPASTADATPPAAVLAGASGEVRGELGSSCWGQPGGTSAVCIDKIAPPTGPTLSVRRGETVTLRFATGLALTGLEVRRDGATLAVPVANPSRFKADLPPGTYQLLVSSTFTPGGSAQYGFRLRVTAPPATPTPAGRVSLTG